MKKLLIHITLAISCLLPCFILAASADNGIYQSESKFIDNAFSSTPQLHVLWLNKEIQQQLASILGHNYPKLRIRYWLLNERSAWILEEIGKEKYITAGFVVGDNKLETVKILEFRESRGWEIKHDFFTEQFSAVGLAQDHQLDKHIDNITGATLSVIATKKMARVALFLHQTVVDKQPP